MSVLSSIPFALKCCTYFARSTLLKAFTENEYLLPLNIPWNFADTAQAIFSTLQTHIFSHKANLQRAKHIAFPSWWILFDRKFKSHLNNYPKISANITFQLFIPSFLFLNKNGLNSGYFKQSSLFDFLNIVSCRTKVCGRFRSSIMN